MNRPSNKRIDRTRTGNRRVLGHLRAARAAMGKDKAENTAAKEPAQMEESTATTEAGWSDVETAPPHPTNKATDNAANAQTEGEEATSSDTNSDATTEDSAAANQAKDGGVETKQDGGVETKQDKPRTVPKRKATMHFMPTYKGERITGSTDAIPEKKKAQTKKSKKEKQEKPLHKKRELTPAEKEKATKRKIATLNHCADVIDKARENKLKHKAAKQMRKSKNQVNQLLLNFNYNFFKKMANAFMIQEWLQQEHEKKPLSESVLLHMKSLEFCVKASLWVEVAEPVVKERYAELIPADAL